MKESQKQDERPEQEEWRIVKNLFLRLSPESRVQR
jgi:hypothetical protein